MAIDRALKKGSAELYHPLPRRGASRHGYEIAKLIKRRSDGTGRFKVASLHPLLSASSADGLLAAGSRNRVNGAKVVSTHGRGEARARSQRDHWREFVHTIALIAGVEHA
jgi:DNA-binding PadR family transcriptional regulator